MGDQIYPGIYLEYVDKRLTQDNIAWHVEKEIRRDSTRFKHSDISVNGITVEILTGDCDANTVNAVVRGINLPYNEILRRLRGRLLGYKLPFQVADVDMGLPRQKSGLLTQQQTNFHKHLKEGYGFLNEGINIFKWPFVMHQLGEFQICQRNLIFNIIRTPQNQRLLAYIPGSVRCTDDKDSKNRRTGVKVRFFTRLDAIQGIMFLNNNKEEFGVDQLWFGNPKPLPRRCRDGLGKDGNPIDFEKVFNQYGYIPLDEFNEDVIDQMRLHETWKSLCIHCCKRYQILGVDPDLNWLAATCGCKLGESNHRWPGDEFFRVTPMSKFSKQFADYSQDLDVTQQYLVLLPRGLKPDCKSVKEFEQVTVSADQYEHQFKVQMHAKKFQIGYVDSRPEVLERREYEGKDGNGNVNINQRLNIELTTSKSSLWSKEGALCMRKITLIPLDNVIEDSPSTWDFQKYLKSAMKGTVQKISNTDVDDVVKVEVIVWCSVSTVLEIGDGFYMIPKPPTSRVDAIQTSLSEWRLYDRHRRIRSNKQKVMFIITTKLKEKSKLHPEMTAWELEFHTNSIPLLTHFDPSSKDIHIGLDFTLPLSNSKKVTVPGRVVKVEDSHHKNCVIGTAIILTHPGLEIYSGMEKKVVFWKAKYDVNYVGQNNSESYLECLADEEVDADWHYKDDESLQEGDDGYFLEHFDVREKPYYFKLESDSLQDQVDSVIYCRKIKSMEMCDFLLAPSPYRNHDPHAKHQLQEWNANGKRAAFSYSKYLNSSQQSAVEGMKKHRLHVTTGPPGCGKTRTGCVGVLEIFAKKQKKGFTLVVCPTNRAASHFHESLLRMKDETGLNLSAIRMMANRREEEIEPEKSHHFFHSAIHSHPDFLHNRQVVRLLNQIEQEGRSLLTTNQEEEIMEHCASVGDKILRNMDVVICTVGAASDNRLDDFFERNSDVKLNALILDEANIVSVSSILPLLALNPQRVWLLGDVRQLCPIVASVGAKYAGLDISWMKLLMATTYYRLHRPISFLREQYRMDSTIAEIVSEWSYQGRLVSASCISQRAFSPYSKAFYDFFPDLKETHFKRISYDNDEYEKGNNFSSYWNVKEANIVRELIVKFEKSNVDLDKVVVLSMYQRQVDEIRKVLGSQYARIPVLTTDCFEGRESPIVILSMVRHNSNHRIGYLRESERINVGISRAMEYLFYISSEKTFRLSKVPEIVALYDLLDKKDIKVSLM